MVNAIVLIVLLVVILIGVAYAISLGNQLVDATQEFAEVFFTSIELREVIPLPTSTEDVCDLRISIRTELTELAPFTELFIRVNFESMRYAWFDCNPSTAIPYFSILDFGKKSTGADPLGFLFFEDIIPVEVELKNFPSDPPVIVNKFLNPNLVKTIRVPAGSVPLPFDLNSEFIITNVPDRNYKLFLSYPTKEINGLSTGQPFVFNVCKQFTVSC